MLLTNKVRMQDCPPSQFLSKSEFLGTFSLPACPQQVVLFSWLIKPVKSSCTESAGAGKIRTCWDLTLTLGIPFSRWGAMPFVLRPIPFSRDVCRDSQMNERRATTYSKIHPFQLALRWQRELATDSQLTKAGIAAREGLSRARVTQIMNLLLLPELIQQQLQSPPPSLKLDLFHERRLRVLLAQNDNVRQLHDWQQWIEELRHSAEN